MTLQLTTGCVLFHGVRIQHGVEAFEGMIQDLAAHLPGQICIYQLR